MKVGQSAAHTLISGRDRQMDKNIMPPVHLLLHHKIIMEIVAKAAIKRYEAEQKGA
jgi:hypothetical protein